MNQDIEELYKRVAELQQIMKNMFGSSTIPRNIETALAERLSNSFPVIIGTSTASTQSVSVASTPTSITVPAQPTGTLTVTYKGITYNLLYK